MGLNVSSKLGREGERFCTAWAFKEAIDTNDGCNHARGYTNVNNVVGVGWLLGRCAVGAGF